MERKALEVEPKVSLIVTIFNSERFLPRALESIHAQTMENFEVLVVDDGSNSDAGAEYATEFLASRRLSGRVIQQCNQGPSAARNQGIRNARGRYISFLDSDDTWFPDAIREQWALLDQLAPSYACIAGAFTRSSAHAWRADRKVYQDEIDGWLDIREYLEGRVAIEGTPAFMYRRAYLEDVQGFDEGLRKNEDFDLLIRIATVGKIKTHTGLTFRQFIRSDSLSQEDPAATLEERLKFVDKLETHCVKCEPRVACRLRQRAYFGVARRLLANGEVGQFVDVMSRGVRETGYPVTWRGWVAYTMARVAGLFQCSVPRNGRRER